MHCYLAAVFGVAAIRFRKRIELVVEMITWQAGTMTRWRSELSGMISWFCCWPWLCWVCCAWD